MSKAHLGRAALEFIKAYEKGAILLLFGTLEGKTYKNAIMLLNFNMAHLVTLT